MNQRLITLLVSLAVALFMAWFLSTHEKVKDVEFIGFQGMARVNDFLAAELLLTELGIDAESRSSVTPSRWLPGRFDTLVTRATAAIAVGEQRDFLISWVLEGGHLVLLPPYEEVQVVEELLADFGFALTQRDDDEMKQSAESDDGDFNEAIESATYDYLLDLDWADYRLELVETDAMSATLEDEIGVVAARRSYADGYVTVIADARIFDNRNLENEDHARLLLDVVAGYIDPNTVYFVYDTAFPALWKIIWTNAPYAVAGSLLLLLVLLWAVIPRFGPRIEPDPPVRRSIVEHVRAAGEFVWQKHGADDLAKSAITLVLHEAESRHPGISRLPADRQARLIAQIVGMDSQTIFDALVGHGDQRPREFTQHMELLQHIRKEL